MKKIRLDNKFYSLITTKEYSGSNEWISQVWVDSNNKLVTDSNIIKQLNQLYYDKL